MGYPNARKNVAKRTLPRVGVTRFSGIAAIGLLLAICLIGSATVSTSGAAAATTSYLRPNSTALAPVPSGFTAIPWAVTGAPSTWEAINDGVTESEVPSSTDYIVASGTGTFYNAEEFGLQTVPLNGAKILKATIWTYVSTIGPVFEQAVSNGSVLAETYIPTGGWQPLNVTISSQAQLNDLRIRYTGAEIGTAAVIQTSFLRLETESPTSRIYWGAWMSGDVYHSSHPSWGDAPWDSNTWTEFENHAQKKASIVHFGQEPPWIASFQESPLSLTAARGSIPLMDMSTNGATLKEVAEGKKDTAIAEWAKKAAAYKKPFFLRLDWEMNGKWFKWGEEAASAPAQFISMWRHFRNVVDENGATNVTWVWCPNSTFSGSTALSSLYPGDNYVEWTCIDGYNEGGAGWTAFSSRFGTTYNELLSLAPNKPIMVGETASAETGGSKPQSTDSHPTLSQE